jgi:hypothetical protein
LKVSSFDPTFDKSWPAQPMYRRTRHLDKVGAKILKKLQSLSKDVVLHWFKNGQKFISSNGNTEKEHKRIDEMIRNRRKAKLIDYFMATLSNDDELDKVLESVESLDDERNYEEEKRLLTGWLKEAEKAEEVLNSVHVGQVFWLTLVRRYFQFTYPVIVTEEKEQEKKSTTPTVQYVAPNLESVAIELTVRDQLPQIFRQPVSSTIGVGIVKKFNLVPLFLYENKTMDRLSSLMIFRLQAWSSIKVQDLGVPEMITNAGGKVKHFYNAFQSLEKLLEPLSVNHQVIFNHNPPTNTRSRQGIDFGKWTLNMCEQSLIHDIDISNYPSSKSFLSCPDLGSNQGNLEKKKYLHHKTWKNWIAVLKFASTSATVQPLIDDVCIIILEYADIYKFDENWQISYTED